MEWLDVGKFISILFGIFSGTYILGAKLVTLYYSKSDELEKLKRDNLKRAIEQLEATVEKQSGEIKLAQELIRKSELEIMKARNDIRDNTVHLNNVMSKVDEYSRTMNKRIAQLERGEWIKIGPETWILKGGKDG